MHSSILLAGACALLAIPSATVAGTARAWEHDSSDVPVDPRIKFGAFENGLRYAWTDQSKGEDKRVYLRLFVDVGSLVETDAEQGVAHFIEHMAFNGTKNFKAGTLVDTFQKEGIKFGHDVNAHTGTDETVYELDLPDASAERLKSAFTWFGDVADGLLFEEKEVASEKGVIDAEERDRNGSGMRIYKKMTESLIGGTLWTRRLPIGVKSARDKFNAALCRGFYRKWYRPEHMTFVASGAFGDADVERWIKETFAGIPAPKEAPQKRPDLGAPKGGVKPFCAYDKEANGCEIVVAKVRPWKDEPDTLANRKRDFLRGQAIALMNGRIAKRVAERAKGEAPYRGVSFGPYELEQALAGFALQVECEPGKWKEALAAAYADFEAARTGAFTRDELHPRITGLHDNLVSEPDATRASGAMYVAKLLQACRARFVPMDDIAQNKMYLKMLPEIDADAMAAQLATTWSDGELVLFAVGNLDLGKTAAADLKAAWDAAEKGAAATTAATGAGKGADAPSADAKPEEDVSASDWMYRAPGAEGKVVKVEKDDALQIARIEFENGVRATLRGDPRAGGGALIVRVGSGLLAVEPDESDIGWVATQVFLQSGLEDHDYETMIKMQKGRQLQFGFQVGVDALVFSGAAGPNDFQRLCEILCAYMKAPGWRPAAFEKWKKGLPEVYEQFGKGFDGPLGEFEKLLHAGDHRFCVPDQKEVDSFLPDTLKEFLEPQLSEGPVEVTALSGIEPNAAITILAKTFGRLSKRGAGDSHDERRKTAPIQPGLKFKKEIETTDKKTLLKVVYPMTDGRDAKLRRTMAFLDDVVDDRMRVEIREKLGAAYSPSVILDAGTAFPGMGSLVIVLTVDPAKADAVLNQVLGAVDTLAKNGVKPDDLDRMKKVATTKLDQAMNDPGWWLGRLDGSWARPEALAELKGVKEAYAAVTAEEVTALARQYLVRKNASTCVIAPKKAAPPPKK